MISDTCLDPVVGSFSSLTQERRWLASEKRIAAAAAAAAAAETEVVLLASSFYFGAPLDL